MNLILEGKSLYSLEDFPLKTPEKIVHLDVSNNFLNKGQEFARFKSLKTLIIDNNSFFSIEDFPKMEFLMTFSANKNKFANLIDFCTVLPEKFPNLVHISLLKNELCPFFSENEEEYEKYKECLLISMPKLKNIDGIQIEFEKKNEKKEKIQGKNIEKNEEKKEEYGKNEENNEENQVFKGTIEYNEKYKHKNPSKNIKTKSEGNRFLKNEQL